MIEWEGITRTYHRGAQQVSALNGVSLRIERGEFVAITGPSGSGKSTLLNILGLLDRPDAGRYLLGVQNVAAIATDDLARIRNEQIGFVFQLFHLLPRTTAVENVELPLVYSDRRHPRGLGLRALERVGLADRAGHHSHELSGGQQQRVAIARALVLGPTLVLADEPTGNLDAAASEEIMTIFRALNDAGTTIVMVTHDIAISRWAGRTISIVDGRIAADVRSGPAEKGAGV